MAKTKTAPPKPQMSKPAAMTKMVKAATPAAKATKTKTSSQPVARPKAPVKAAKIKPAAKTAKPMSTPVKAANVKSATAAKSAVSATAKAKPAVTKTPAPAKRAPEVKAAAPVSKVVKPADKVNHKSTIRAVIASNANAAAKPAAGPAPRAMPAAAAKTPVQKAAPAPAMKAPPVAKAATAAPAPAQPVAAAADKKPVSQRHGFKCNEFIVYPAHGVGRIIGIEEQEIAGMSLELFVITFEKDKMTLRVPTSKLESVGMRKLASDDLVKKATETLKGRARIKRTMWSRRAQEYEAKINSGDLVSIAEVVRDLYRSEAQPEQSYSERQLYEAALDRMARELAAVDKIDERGAVQRITEILSKSAKGRKSAAEAIAEADESVEAA